MHDMEADNLNAHHEKIYGRACSINWKVSNMKDREKLNNKPNLTKAYI